MTLRTAMTTLTALALAAAMGACPDDGDGGGTDTTDVTADVPSDTEDDAVDVSPEVVEDITVDEGGDEGGEETVEDIVEDADEDTAEDVAAPVTLCLELTDCLRTACESHPTDDLATCFADNYEGCGIDPAALDAEATAAEGLASCLATAQCDLTQADGYYECAASKCVTEVATCYAGPTWGTNDACPDVRECIYSCEPDIFGNVDLGCWRDCAAQGTEDAVSTYVELYYCLEENCGDKEGADKETCVQQAQIDPLCFTQFTNCQGTDI